MNLPKALLLVVDMQRSFCESEGVSVQVGGPLHGIEAVTDNLVGYIDRARREGMRIAFTRHGYAPDYSDQGRSAGSFPISRAVRQLGGVIRGSDDHQIVAALVPEEGDIVIDKVRLDAFLHTPLESTLRNLGVDSIVVGGCVTNFCVETTVRSAWQRDFDVTVLADGVAAYTPEMQQRGLDTIAECCFARVSTGPEALLRPSLVSS